MASLLKGFGFITGAASGIGKATAFSFAKYGARGIAIGDMNATAVKATASELNKAFPGVEILPLEVDVADEQSINKAVSDTAAKFGRIDYAVNNAGIAGSHARSGDHELSDWQRLMSINLTGVWMSSRAEIRQMLKQEPLEPNSVRFGKGTIINVASMYGIVGTSRDISAVAYTTSKHGVVGMTKADAAAYAADGIRINAICPGYVATPLLQTASSMGVMQKEIEKTPAGRIADMDEIGDAITYLASPLSSFMNGSGMVIDGGFTAQ